NALNPLTAGVLASRGEEARTIAALETVWSPMPVFEIATRYAARRTSALIPQLDGSTTSQQSTADYVGNRVNVDITPWLARRPGAGPGAEHASPHSAPRRGAA